MLQRPGTLQRAAAPDKLDISKPNHHHLIKECQLNLLGHVARQVVASVAAVVAVALAVAVAVPLTVSLTVAFAVAVLLCRGVAKGRHSKQLETRKTRQVSAAPKISYPSEEKFELMHS